MSKIRDWAATLVFAPIFAGILIFFDPILRLASLFGITTVESTAVHMQHWLLRSFRLVGIRPDFELSPDIQPHQSYIFVSNHQSMFDIPLFTWAFPTNNGKYISKKELEKGIPGISTNLRLGNHPLIDRADRESAVKEIGALAVRLKRNEVSAVIFPEGGRSKDGQLKNFKPAGLQTLLSEAPEVLIVPCCLDNSWQMMRYNFRPIPFGVHLRFWAGAPMRRQEGESEAEFIGRLHQTIGDKLGSWRTHNRTAAAAHS